MQVLRVDYSEATIHLHEKELLMLARACHAAGMQSAIFEFTPLEKDDDQTLHHYQVLATLFQSLAFLSNTLGEIHPSMIDRLNEHYFLR